MDIFLNSWHTITVPRCWLVLYSLVWDIIHSETPQRREPGSSISLIYLKYIDKGLPLNDEFYRYVTWSTCCSSIHLNSRSTTRQVLNDLPHTWTIISDWTLQRNVKPICMTMSFPIAHFLQQHVGLLSLWCVSLSVRYRPTRAGIYIGPLEPRYRPTRACSDYQDCLIKRWLLISKQGYFKPRLESSLKEFYWRHCLGPPYHS